MYQVPSEFIRQKTTVVWFVTVEHAVAAFAGYLLGEALGGSTVAIVGPTGAGKSALLVYLLQQMAAVYRPRLFIIEAGGSFSLLGQHFAANGLTLNQVTLNPNADVSLPPFADALRLLEKERRLRIVEDPNALAEDEDDDADAEPVIPAVFRYCHHCHGQNGDGRIIVGESLETKPADLRSFKVQAQTDEALFDHLQEGGESFLVAGLPIGGREGSCLPGGDVGPSRFCSDLDDPGAPELDG